MIRFFKTYQPAIMIIIPFIILAFWVPSFHDITHNLQGGLPLWDAVASFVAWIPSWLSFFLMFLLISSQAIYLNFMLNRHDVIYKNTFIPALIFAFFVSASPAFMQFHPIHIVNLLIIRVFDRLFTLFKSEYPVSALFDIGFISGIIALLFFPGLFLLPVLFTALAIQRSFRFKEWLITLIGFVLPFFFLSVIMFWMHSLIAFWNDYTSHFTLLRPEFNMHLTLPLTVVLIFIGLLLILSLLKLRANYRKNVIRMRIYQQIFFIFLLVAAVSVFLLRTISLLDFLYILIPVTVFCAYFFVSAKKRVYLYEYALWVLIGLMVWNQLI